MNTAQAQTVYAFEDEEEKGPWQEAPVALPAAPVQSQLLPLDVAQPTSLSFFVDPASISVGADGVVRYTVVSVSSGGARNTSYEGIHCKTFERRVYAFGHADGTWSPSKSGNWTRIARYGRNAYPSTLALDYFCKGVTVAGSAEQMVSRIRRKEVLNPHGEN